MLEKYYKFEYLDFLSDKDNETFKKIYEQAIKECEELCSYDELNVLIGYLNSKDFHSFSIQISSLLPYLCKWGLNTAIIFSIYCPLKEKYPSLLYNNITIIKKINEKKNYFSNESLSLFISCYKKLSTDSNLYDLYKKELIYVSKFEEEAINWGLSFHQGNLTSQELANLIEILFKDQAVSLVLKSKLLYFLSNIDTSLKNYQFKMIGQRDFNIYDFSINKSNFYEFINEKNYKNYNDDKLNLLQSLIVKFVSLINNPILNEVPDKVNLIANMTDLYYKRLQLNGDCRYKKLDNSSNLNNQIKIVFNQMYVNFEFDSFKDEDEYYCDCDQSE